MPVSREIEPDGPGLVRKLFILEGTLFPISG
jgi:hypothetical protein